MLGDDRPGVAGLETLVSRNEATSAAATLRAVGCPSVADPLVFGVSVARWRPTGPSTADDREVVECLVRDRTAVARRDPEKTGHGAVPPAWRRRGRRSWRRARRSRCRCLRTATSRAVPEAKSTAASRRRRPTPGRRSSSRSRAGSAGRRARARGGRPEGPSSRTRAIRRRARTSPGRFSPSTSRPATGERGCLASTGNGARANRWRMRGIS